MGAYFALLHPKHTTNHKGTDILLILFHLPKKKKKKWHTEKERSNGPSVLLKGKLYALL